MNAQEQKEFFEKNGYLVVPNILTREQVQLLRKELRPKFERTAEERYSGDSESFMADIFSRNPSLRWLLFHEPTLKVLRSLLGDDFVVLREAAAHFQVFGDWHKDTTSQEKAGEKFHWDPDFLMVEVSYYLQDNSEEYGGGLDIEPGSHREKDYFANPPLAKSRLEKMRDRIFGDGKSQKMSIPSKAGDLVIFHFRANHRATQRTRTDAPPDKQKMSIFVACSRNTPHVKRYHDFIGTRPSYTYLQGGFSYPADFAQEAKAHGINMP